MAFRLWGKVLILSAGVIIVYVNSFLGVLQFDDLNMIVNYARAHSFASWLSYFIHNIRPLLKTSYTFNWISGLGLFGFHLFNLAVHIINTILVYIISYKFLSREKHLPYINAAFLAALFFGLHPVQTEAVTYICGRSVSLMALFYLGSLLAYVTGTEKDSPIMIYVLSPLLFIMAFLTRETAVTLPAALLLWDLCYQENGRAGIALRRQSVHWMLLFVILVAVLFHFKYERLLEVSFEARGIKENLLSQINALYYDLSRLVAVHDLNIDPDIPVFTSWSPAVLLKAILIISIFIVSLISIKKNRWVSFGLLWFFLQLIPTNSIVPRLDIANERHMYLPGLGIFLVISVGIEKLRTGFFEHRRLFKAGIVALLLILGYFTWSRNNDYRGQVAMWEDTVRKSPEKARCYNNLGYAYELDERYEEASKAYMKALELNPDYNFPKNNLKKIDAVLNNNK